MSLAGSRSCLSIFSTMRKLRQAIRRVWGGALGADWRANGVLQRRCSVLWRRVAHSTRFERVARPGFEPKQRVPAGRKDASQRARPPATNKVGSRDCGFRDVANLRHCTKRSHHHHEDIKRFLMLVIAYDSLPEAPKLRFSTLAHDLVRLRSLDDRRERRSRISLPRGR